MGLGRIILLILGILLAAGALFFGPYIGIESLALRILIAVVVLLPVPLLLLIGILRKRKAKTVLEQPVQKIQVDPEVRAQLKGKLQQLAKVLEASKVAGETALHLMPRVLVIGGPGSGKSSAVRWSRLDFPFSTAQDKTDSQDLEIWVSKLGTLFDVPGRYESDEGGDHAAWLELLRLLSQAKRPVPVEGIVVTVDLRELLASSADDAEAAAARMRRRLIEAIDTLGWCMPVYLLFTKTDLLPGFIESFGVLPSAERAQPFGFIMEEVEPTRIKKELDGLIRSAREKAYARLPLLKQDLRPGTYSFNEHLDAAAPEIETFLRRLCEPSAANDRVQLSGVYFASAGHEGSKVDLVGARLQDQFGITPAPAVGSELDETRSFFLNELFAKVVLPGVRAAERSSLGNQRYRKKLAITMAGCLLGATVIGGYSLVSYSNNNALVSSTMERVQKLGKPQKATLTSGDLERLDPLSPVAERLLQLEQWEKDGPPFSYRFGFYKGSELLPPLRRAFERPMQGLFVERVGVELESMLSDQTGSGNVVRDYDVLKAYLMLTREKKRLEADFVAAILVEVWKRRLDTTASAETELLMRLARTYVRQVQRDAARWPAPSATLIGDSRASLRRRNAEFERIMADARQQAGRHLTLSEIVGGRVPDSLIAGTDVDRLYTLDGWRVVRNNFDEANGAKAWVLGEFASDDAMIDKTRERYLKQYAAAWRNLLRDLTIREARSLPDARRVLDELTKKPSILESLFLGIKSHMTFPTATQDALAKTKKFAKAKKASSKMPKKKNSVQREFTPLFELVAPTPLADGTEPKAALGELITKLGAVKAAIDALDAAENADTREVTAAIADARTAVETVFRNIPDPLNKLLKPLFLDALRGATEEAESERFQRTAVAFKTKVCAPYHESLAGRFPFADSPDDALLDSVTAIFGPTGSAWTFFEQHLKNDLHRVGDSLEVKGAIDKEVVTFYRTSTLISATLFPGNAESLAREYMVRPQGILTSPGAGHATGVTLELGGERKTYRFGPAETWTFAWPSKIGRARLSLEGLTEPAIEAWGDWALFRLADHASKKKLAGGWVELKFEFKGGKVKVPLHVRTRGTKNPLLQYRRFRLACERGDVKPK